MRRYALGVLLLSACSHSGQARNAEMAGFHAASAGANVDPTLRPARLLPEVVDESLSFGAEPGGGTRILSAGLRLVSSSKGGLLTATDRLPQAPTSTTAIPERLGGGFLFVIGSAVWRADHWLESAKPIFVANQPVQAVLPGLDRVYLRTATTTIPIDGRNGHVLDLGPWPQSPYVASYAAADGWRAAAVTDMRGLVATFDAGATWRAVPAPSFDSKQVVASGDSLAIGGFEENKPVWYELRADASLARLAAPPREAAKTKLVPPTVTMRGPFAGATITTTTLTPIDTPDATSKSPEQEDSATKTFGKRPLATAIEDGWPLTDGTAVVARDGALGRVRLSDGMLIEVVRDAFPLKPSRCHPVSLTRPNASGAFGFVCGEPRGATVLYAYEPLRGRLAEIKRFDRPRVVTASGNGALAVRGPCAEDGEPSAPPRPEPAKLPKDDKEAKAKEREEVPPVPPAPPAAPATEIHPYCVLGYDNTWREVHVRGDVGGERVVVLADGRLVVVSPPQALGTPARVTILDKGKAQTMAVTFPRVAKDVEKVLRYGFWLDGFEERRPGVVGGWIEAGGVMLGIELALDGTATMGQLVRDAGMPFVSGRYGLGWTGAHRGYETTDGGMTWSTIDLPDPLVPAGKVERRACGPIGCLADGWLRVGWGEAKVDAPTPMPPVYRAASPLLSPVISLACEPVAPPRAAAPAPKPSTATQRPQPMRPFGSQPVLGTMQGSSELPAFAGQPATTLHDGERGLSIDVHELIDRNANIGSLARVYAWGPKTGEWETLGRWQVKWQSPFAGWPEIHSSLPVLPPQAVIDWTRLLNGVYGYAGASILSNSGYTLAAGDDSAHALLYVRKQSMRNADSAVFEVEADRAPIEVRRADGEPFPELDGAVRAAGRWFVVATAATNATWSSVWQIEGGVARELVRVPRMLQENAPTKDKLRLARRSDGRAIGIVTEGSPTIERAQPQRWVTPIDLESGAIGEPELVGYTDLAGRSLDACSDDLVGWVFDAPLPQGSVRMHLGGSTQGSIGTTQARLRLTATRACIERLAGTYDGQSADRAAALSRAGIKPTTALRPGEIGVTAMSMQTRFPLRCSIPH